MRVIILVLGLAFVASACASNEELASESNTATGRRVVNVVATPFYAVGKGTWCVLSTVAAVPINGALRLSRSHQEKEVRQNINRTVGDACRGSYWMGTEDE